MPIWEVMKEKKSSRCWKSLLPHFQAIFNVLEEKVTAMIEKANNDYDSDLLPLLRLRVDWTGYMTVSTSLFGQRFVGRVANPNDLLLWHKRSNTKVISNLENDDLLQLRLAPNPMEQVVEAHPQQLIEDLVSHLLSPAGDAVLLKDQVTLLDTSVFPIFIPRNLICSGT